MDTASFDVSVKSAVAVELVESAVGLRAPKLLVRVTGKALALTQRNRAKYSSAVKTLAPEWLVGFLVMSSALSRASFPLRGLLLGYFRTALYSYDLHKLREEGNFRSLLLIIYFIARLSIEILE